MKRTATGWLLALALGAAVTGAWAAAELECASRAEPRAMPAVPAPSPSIPTDSELDLEPGDWLAVTF